MLCEHSFLKNYAKEPLTKTLFVFHFVGEAEVISQIPTSKCT
jgi:hypothetical protein